MFHAGQQTFNKCLLFARYYASWRDKTCPKQLTSAEESKRVLRGYKGTACIVKRRNYCHEKTEGINLDCRIWEGFVERLDLFTET